MARLYSSTALKANLRVRILSTHLLQGPASVMLTSFAAGVMKKGSTMWTWTRMLSIGGLCSKRLKIERLEGKVSISAEVDLLLFGQISGR